MINFIKDIIDDPKEYLPMLIICSVFWVFWGGLCVSGFISLRAATRRRRFWFALAPLIFGLIGVMSQMPFSMEGEGFRLSFDFRWFFFLPLLLGVAGAVKWWRMRPESVA